MTTALSPILISRLEKAATDNGFDQTLDPEGDWLVVASTQCPLRVWIGAFGDAVFLAAGGPNSFRSLGLKAQCPIKDTGVGRTIDQALRARASPRTFLSSVKDTFGVLSLNHVLYGLATRGAFEAWRCP